MQQRRIRVVKLALWSESVKSGEIQGIIIVQCVANSMSQREFLELIKRIKEWRTSDIERSKLLPTVQEHTDQRIRDN
jgi:hypothetical protein